MIKRSGVGDITAGVIRYDGYVVAHFVLVRVTNKRIERLTHRDVRRPAVAAVCAVGIKELRVGIIRRVPAIQPNYVDSSIWSHCERAKPMPFELISRIIIDSDWR